MTDDVERYCRTMSEVLRQLPVTVVDHVGELLWECYRRGGTVFIAGNGGSASTASHFACDLVKGTRNDPLPRFRVVALTDNVPLITAWANDSSYDRIFAEQLSSLVRDGDLVILISASGNSPNILEAARAAGGAGAQTVALAGSDGGRVSGLADVTVCVPAETMEQVEDGHSVITHALCMGLRRRLQLQSERPVPGQDPAGNEHENA